MMNMSKGEGSVEDDLLRVRISLPTISSSAENGPLNEFTTTNA